VVLAVDPKRLLLTVRDGNAGFRAANTMPAVVAIYNRIRKRQGDFDGEDYLFYPHYKNRTTASKIVQRQFRELMSQAEVEVDRPTGKPHTLYSLRHTAICMRTILSHGKVNIFNPAKNAGTSVDQIALLCPLLKPVQRNGHEPAQLWGQE